MIGGRLRRHHFHHHCVVIDLDAFDDAAVKVGLEERLIVGGILQGSFVNPYELRQT